MASAKSLPFSTISLLPSLFPLSKPLLRPKPSPSPPIHYLGHNSTSSKELNDASTGTEYLDSAALPVANISIPLLDISPTCTTRSKGLSGSPVKRNTVEWGKQRKNRDKQLWKSEWKWSGVSVENLLERRGKRQGKCGREKSSYQSRTVLSNAPQRFRRRKYVSSDSCDLQLIGREITTRGQSRAGYRKG